MRADGRPWRKVIRLAAVAVAALTCVSVQVRAEEGFFAPAPDNGVHLDIGIGLWALFANGSAGIGPLSTDVDVGFDDIVENLDYGAMGGAELTKSNWVVAFNGMYGKLSGSQGLPFGGDLDAEARTGIADLGVGYTIFRTRFENDMTLAVTPAIGARYTHLKLELEPARLPSVEQDRDWVDPYVGGRVVLGLTPTLDWRNDGTIGGFSIDGGSTLTWSAQSMLDWQFSKGVTLNVGYRALSWNYDQDNFKWDVIFHGPWVGLTVRWF